MQHNVGAGQVEMKSPLVSGNSGQNPIVQELATHPSQPLSAIAAGSQNHTHTLSNDFTYFRLKAPVVAPAAPQAISSMGVPVTSAIHHAVAASFIVTGQGWDGDTRNPDEPSKREARIKHVLDCTLRDRHGLDLMSLETDRSQAHIASVAVMPDIEAFIRSDEKIIAVLNCAEVFGAPDSRNLFSKGFVQVAIIERSDSKGATRRLIVYSLSGNLACTLNEDVGQKFENSSTTETECCCFTKQRGYDLRMGSADYKYSVVSQSNSEITMLNIENSIVHVQVTKTKIDNLHAQNNPPAPVAASTFFFTVKPTSKGCCDDLCVCDDKSGGCGCRCPAFSCFGDCCDCCSSKKVTTNGGSRHVQYNNTIGRIFGYTSILNVGGVPKPVVAARDSEQGAPLFSSTGRS
jgi:hypothetical protein